MYREKVLEHAKIFTPAKFQHANFRDSLYGQPFALTTYSCFSLNLTLNPQLLAVQSTYQAHGQHLITRCT